MTPRELVALARTPAGLVLATGAVGVVLAVVVAATGVGVSITGIEVTPPDVTNERSAGRKLPDPPEVVP